MSSYTDPPTNGKVVFHTTSGDLEIELWPKEAPKTCRNFVQLCLEGYYNGTVFHRIIKDFIVQGGDPTGTGFGGESIYGSPFADEIHSRLRFGHRGILAMASSAPNDNRSQFFFTLRRADHLNQTNTIFGKIVGDTIYNLLKIGESETDEEENPLYSTKIISVDVLHNPFDDIIPREKVQTIPATEKIEKRPKGKKDLKLLSFGAEEEEEEVNFKKKVKSSHDLDTNDPRLSKEAAVNIETLPSINAPKTKNKIPKRQKVKLEDSEDFDFQKMEMQPDTKKLYVSSIFTFRDSIQAEIQKMKDELSVKKAPVPKKKKERVSYLDEFKKQYTQGKALIGRRQGKEDEKTLDMLQNFKKKLLAEKSSVHRDESSWSCELHGMPDCESCRDTFGKEEEINEEGWLASSLVFQKKKAANVYEPKADDYILIDPRSAPKAVYEKKDLPKKKN